MRRNLFFAPAGREGGTSERKPRISEAVRNVLTDANDKQLEKEKRNGTRSNAKPSADAMSLYQIGRMLSDNYSTLSEYLADFMSNFADARRCTVYLSSRRKVDGKDVSFLTHHLTVVRENDRYKPKNVGEAILDRRSRALIAFRQAKPTVLHFRPRIRMVFKNLDRRNMDYEIFRLRPEKTDGMKAFIPFHYREGSPTGLLVFEGDLRLRGSKREGEEAMWLSAMAGSLAASQISFQLTHKFDVTTKLKGKVDFRIDLENAIKQIKKGKLNSLYVLLIDLDKFKMVNERYGYFKGDEMLRETAEAILASLRTGDDRPVDFVYRWGGEEFAVILSGENVTSEGAKDTAQRINRAVSNIRISARDDQPRSEDNEIGITCSIGGADTGAILRFKQPTGIKKSSKTAFELCNALLREAKESGRNTVFFAEIRGNSIVKVKYSNGDAKHY